MQLVNKTQAMASAHHEFTHPIRDLALAPNGTLWAGVGALNDRGPEHTKQQGDPMHVYRSDNGGASWVGVLKLPGGGAVEGIAANDGATGQAQTVAVASATGLFVSHDRGPSHQSKALSRLGLRGAHS